MFFHPFTRRVHGVLRRVRSWLAGLHKSKFFKESVRKVVRMLIFALLYLYLDLGGLERLDLVVRIIEHLG